LGVGEKAGRLFGQPRLNDGTRMDKVFKHQWVVVCDADLADGLDLPKGVGLVTTVNSNAADHLAKLGVKAAVLRPDRHTFGTADNPEDLQALIARVLPALTSNKQPEMV
jgi:3-(3-hydroxy-phenyl)propionate hydroxylase